VTYEFEWIDTPDTGLGGDEYRVTRDGVLLGNVRHIFPYGRDPYWVATRPRSKRSESGFVPGNFDTREDAADALAIRF
jgi:hypothetical protein